jgi:hypothetical protein
METVMVNNLLQQAQNWGGMVQQTTTGPLMGGTAPVSYFPPAAPYAPNPSWSDIAALQQTIMALQGQIFQLQERLHKIQDIKTWLTGDGDAKETP